MGWGKGDEPRVDDLKVMTSQAKQLIYAAKSQLTKTTALLNEIAHEQKREPMLESIRLAVRHMQNAFDELDDVQQTLNR